MPNPNSGATPAPVDLTNFRAAVQLRDRCRVAAMSAHERAGLPPSVGYANSTYDAIADLIREDERSRARAAPPADMEPDGWHAVARDLRVIVSQVQDATHEAGLTSDLVRAEAAYRRLAEAQT